MDYLCVSSGTAALHLAVQASTKPGDEVLVQSLTFVSSFQAISAARAKPVSYEVHPETITINLRDAENRITKKTRAIMPVTLEILTKFTNTHKNINCVW